MISNARRFAAALLALPLLAAGTHAQTTLDCQPPQVIGMLEGLTNPTTVTIEDNYAYFIDDYEYFTIVDLANPAAPSLLARVELIGEYPHEITIISDAAYLHGQSEISIYNIEDKTDPWFRRFYSVPLNSLNSEARTQSHIYLERDFALNIDRPLAPGIDRYQPIEKPFDSIPVIIHNGQLITERRSRYDLTDPLNPALISEAPSGTLPRYARYDEPYLISSDSASVEITTLHDHTPILLDRYITTMGQEDATVRGDLIFTANGTIDVYAPATYPLLIASFMLDPDFYAQQIRRLGDNFVVFSQDRLAVVSIPTNPLGAARTSAGQSYITRHQDLIIASSESISKFAQRINIIDTSDPLRPDWIAELPLVAPEIGSRGSAVYEDTLLVAERTTGLNAFNISNPAAPIPLGVYPTNTDPKELSRTSDIEIRGNYAYVIDQTAGLLTYEIMPDTSLKPVSTLRLPGTKFFITLLDDIALVCSTTQGVLIDLTDPETPTLLSTIEAEGTYVPAFITAHREGDLLYTAEVDLGYRIFDITDPADPIELAQFDADVSTPQGDFEAFVYDILVEDDTLYVSMSSGGFAIYDNTNIFAPVLLAHTPSSIPQKNSLTRYREFVKEGSLVYIAAGEAGVHVLSLDGCSIPCVIDYNNDGALDFFDVTAFIVAFNNTDSAADLNDDGELNFFDITAFITAFQSGCP